MSELTTKRTLVKSPPELWAEVSDLEALARHLGEFGEIRITRLEPETTVVWEGDRACGTVRLEPSGWGTKVTLTAELAELEAAAEPVVEEEPQAVEEPPVAEEPAPAEPEPEPVPEPEAVEPPPPSPIVEAPPAKKVGFWARLFGRKQAPVAEVPPVEEPAPEPPPVEEPPAPEPPAPPPPLQPVPEPEPPAEPEPDEPLPAATTSELDGDRAVAVLTEVLDNLGAAHHRPFSRG